MSSSTRPYRPAVERGTIMFNERIGGFALDQSNGISAASASEEPSDEPRELEPISSIALASEKLRRQLARHGKF